MPFHWIDASSEISERFPEGIHGFPLWRMFLELLSDPLHLQGAEGDRSEDIELLASRALSVFDTSESPVLTAPTVFVSHQSQDLDYAERVAWIACSSGIDYWLDIHDPTLTHANQTIPKSSTIYSVLVAGIIEMALLNSSHLIAVHSDNSLRSRWIPYEFGRVRDRRVLSGECGSWFHPKTIPANHGDYLQLVRTTQGGEIDITHWLSLWSTRTSPLNWKRSAIPRSLP